MKVAKHIFSCLLISAIMTGCNMNDQGREADRPGDMNNQHVGARRNAEHALGNPNMSNLNVNNTTNTNRTINVNTTQLQVAPEADERVERLPEIKRAHIIVANRNAYVAVVMEKGFDGEVSSVIEDDIAEQIWDTYGNIRNVYVSSNADFVNRMEQYENMVRNGMTTTDLNVEFEQVTHRLFQNHRR